MPTRREHKERIKKAITERESKYTADDLKFYKEISDKYGSKENLKSLREKMQRSAEKILNEKEKGATVDGLQNGADEKESPLDELRKAKSKEITEKIQQRQNELDELNGKLEKGGMTDEEKKDMTVRRKKLLSEIEEGQDLNTFVKVGREGEFFASEIYGDVNLTAPTVEQPQADDSEKEQIATEEEIKDFNKFARMRNDLEKSKYKQVHSMVNEYAEKKSSFESLSGWQRFWGRILPANAYGPANAYAEIKAYEDVVKEEKIDVDAHLKEIVEKPERLEIVDIDNKKEDNEKWLEGLQNSINDEKNLQTNEKDLEKDSLEKQLEVNAQTL